MLVLAWTVPLTKSDCLYHAEVGVQDRMSRDTNVARANLAQQPPRLAHDTLHWTQKELRANTMPLVHAQAMVAEVVDMPEDSQ